jgi:hypothetical protein
MELAMPTQIAINSNAALKDISAESGKGSVLNDIRVTLQPISSTLIGDKIQLD